MPAALPPAGEYDVRIEPAAGRDHVTSTESRGSATIDGEGGLAVSGVAAADLPGRGTRYRVVFPGS
jgi:hypothetical protein